MRKRKNKEEIHSTVSSFHCKKYIILKDIFRYGSGSFYFINGDRFVGEWSRDKMNGAGVYHYTNGDRLVRMEQGQDGGKCMIINFF